LKALLIPEEKAKLKKGFVEGEELGSGM